MKSFAPHYKINWHVDFSPYRPWNGAPLIKRVALLPLALHVSLKRNSPNGMAIRLWGRRKNVRWIKISDHTRSYRFFRRGENAPDTCQSPQCRVYGTNSHIFILLLIRWKCIFQSNVGKFNIHIWKK